MAKTFSTPAAFRKSLEDRLRTTAAANHVPVKNIRTKFAIERLLARLFTNQNPPWLLKGGYALELRYRPSARTTSDIDLTVEGNSAAALAQRLAEIRDELQKAANQDLGDFLEILIGAPNGELAGAPQGGSTFPVEVKLAGKTFEKFHIDLGFGDASLGTPESLTGQDFLNFAGIPPAKALAIPTAQQFAEKIHAYTLDWKDRKNSRTKDLVDLILLLDKGLKADTHLRQVVQRTFETRKKQPVPVELPAPPADWKNDFESMAKEARLSTTDLGAAFTAVQIFWRSLNQAS